MNDRAVAVATACLKAAEENTKSFPQILAALYDAGFEGYEIDFRRGSATYYTTDGGCIVLETHKLGQPIAPVFDATTLQAAIREAQQKVEGYTYLGFCKRRPPQDAPPTLFRSQAVARFISGVPPRRMSSIFRKRERRPRGK